MEITGTYRWTVFQNEGVRLRPDELEGADEDQIPYEPAREQKESAYRLPSWSWSSIMCIRNCLASFEQDG
ncbi:unnamed protein product [Clonostachys rosea f. rosea IK726]|uniref:Uncharacterized protein n=1 Tax=Clonostachys rosea f. rosea IK726 TaxID=1349383 RepID=A0ACA9TBX7_BIOOC|nr:unnamed protein product [Clonostachys rosea f. rosea IK726]